VSRDGTDPGAPECNKQLGPELGQHRTETEGGRGDVDLCSVARYGLDHGVGDGFGRS
jgi:hypothetical protein